jgi:hypothetical protein
MTGKIFTSGRLNSEVPAQKGCFVGRLFAIALTMLKYKIIALVLCLPLWVGAAVGPESTAKTEALQSDIRNFFDPTSDFSSNLFLRRANYPTYNKSEFIWLVAREITALELGPLPVNGRFGDERARELAVTQRINELLQFRELARQSPHKYLRRLQQLRDHIFRINEIRDLDMRVSSDIPPDQRTISLRYLRSQVVMLESLIAIAQSGEPQIEAMFFARFSRVSLRSQPFDKSIVDLSMCRESLFVGVR